jgi:hypothetical protein
MSQQLGVIADYTLNAAGNLSTKQFTFVKMSADYTVTTASAVGDGIIGIQQDDLATAAGMGVAIRPIPGGGTSWIKMGAAAAVGSPITTDANGLGAVATSGQRYYGRLLQASTAAGDIVEMALMNGTV